MRCVKAEVTPEVRQVTDKNLRQKRTGEVADQARRSGVQNVEQMNKQQMIQAMSQGQGRGGRSQQQARSGGAQGRGQQSARSRGR
jgi:hypothetical protein